MKKTLLLSFLIILTTCSKDSGAGDTPPPIVKYTLSVTASPTEGGLVNPQSGSYNPGEQVTILASPNQYYGFDKWTGGWNGKENQVTITMDSNKTIVGNFIKVDNDEDGVLNTVDNCLETPEGASVDSNGCALTQLDSDGDGVTDNADLCENTNPEAQLLTPNGCEIPVLYLENDTESSVGTPTLKAAEEAEIGMQYYILGDTYTIVDETQLRNMVQNGENISFVVTSRVTDMSELFKNHNFSNNAYQYLLARWDVSNVTNMESMFENSDYNADLSGWDVQNVTNMKNMFKDVEIFNMDIDTWDVSSVTNMEKMFYNAANFNSDISDWNVSNVSNMSYMFSSATSFNSDISDWDVSNVTNMYEMFANTNYNKPLVDWNVSNVTNMSKMFLQAESFNQDLSSWDVSNVIECDDFSTGASQWSLWKPVFTNCEPGFIIDYSIPSNFQLSSSYLAPETFYSILLQWDYNNDPNIISINIYRGEDSSSLTLYENISNSSNSQYKDTQVSVRKDYYYAISYVYNNQEHTKTQTLSRQAYEPINTNNITSNQVGGVHYAYQYFPVNRFDSIKHKFTIHSEPSNNTPLYYQFYQGNINDDIGFYYGIQTLMSSTNNPNPRGKALIFSRWKTNDSSNLSLAEGGWSEVAGYEGDFISVRNAYEWTAGTYEIELKKDSTDVVGDWYSLKIKSFPNGTEVHAGSLRFESSSSASGIKSGGIVWTEIYGAGPYPDWHVSVDDITINENQKPSYIWTTYSSKFKDFSNIYTTNNCDIHFLMGPNVKNIRPAYTFNWCE